MKTTTLVACALLVLVALVASLRTRTAAQTAPLIPVSANLNTVSLNFTTAQMVDSQTVRAFVPTGSKSVKCLATFNETNNVQPGTSLFCGEREPAAFGGTPGMLVSVFFSQPV